MPRPDGVDLPVFRPHREPARRRNGLIVALGLVVLLGGGYLVQSRRDRPEVDGYGSMRTAATLGPAATVTAGRTGAPHHLEVYEDPRCPFCGQLERRFGQLVARAVDEGRLRVTYHVLAFLDGESADGTYSTRSANALLCVAESAGGAFGRFHDRLYDPAVQDEASRGSGRSDDTLLADARAAGAGSPAVESCVRQGRHGAAVRAATGPKRAEVGGTPRLRLDGTLLDPDAARDGDWADPLR